MNFQLQFGAYFIIVYKPISNCHRRYEEQVDLSNDSSFDGGVNGMAMFSHDPDRNVFVICRLARTIVDICRWTSSGGGFSSLLSGKVLILVVAVQVEDAVRTEIFF
jgi:hypothetical protein